LRHVVWWLNLNVSEDRPASIFRVKLRGERKVNRIEAWWEVPVIL
jgi:hypothetical protein